MLEFCPTTRPLHGDHVRPSTDDDDVLVVCNPLTLGQQTKNIHVVANESVIRLFARPQKM